MSLTSTSPIAVRSSRCLQFFDRLCSLLDDETSNQLISLTVCLDESDRFRLWANNIGAFLTVDNRNSLDFRLREVSKICGQVVEFLEDLAEALDDACSIVLGTRPNRIVVNTDISSGLEFRVSEFNEIFGTVKDSITSLMQTSIIIRNATPRDRYVKAQSSTKNRFLDCFDIAHVGHKFPKIDSKGQEWLKRRLGRAITQRRQYLKYCRDHHDKFSQEKEASQKTEGADESSRSKDPTSALDPMSKIQHEGGTVRSLPMSAFTPTTASTLQPSKLEANEEGDVEEVSDSYSQTSYATSVHGNTTESKLHTPSLRDVTSCFPFECPYCWTLQNTMNEKTWRYEPSRDRAYTQLQDIIMLIAGVRKHVFTDLRPYVCTFEHCDLKMFADRHVWFNHELECHRLEWCCPFCSHPPLRSETEMSTHMVQQHGQSSSSTQLPLLIKASKQSVHRVPAAACPLCDWDTALRELNTHASLEEILVVTLEQFRRHLGAHMEQLALFALPQSPNEGEESADSNEAAAMAHSDSQSCRLSGEETMSWKTLSDGEATFDKAIPDVSRNVVPSIGVDHGPSIRSETLEPVFLVPFERDHSFINRIEIFNDINKILKQHGRVALSGIGGVGKSQIAIEYCYRFRDDHPNTHIFWVNAITAYRFYQAYKDIARRLELPGWSDPKTSTLRLVSDWFNGAGNGNWLMILDNADDLDLLFGRPTSTAPDNDRPSPLIDYLPRSSGGITLITTRDERLGKRLAGTHASIVVNHMSPEEAQDLLGKSQIDPSGSSNDNSSECLCEALGYIPLAITQAAAFMNENHFSLTGYLAMFYESDSDAQTLLGGEYKDHRRDTQSYDSIINTWKMCFDIISKQNPRAAELLSLMAVLDRQGIPESLLRQETDRIVDFLMALGTLQAFSLVSAEVKGVGYEIHRLVQLAALNWLGVRGEIGMWQEKALSVVAKTFPNSESEDWKKKCESLLPHAQKVIQYEDVNEKHPLEYSTLLSNLARFDAEQGRYEIAYARYSAAIEVQKQTFGMDHDSTLISMHGLAITCQKQGRFEEAEKLLVQLIEAKTKLGGAEHPDTLLVMSKLALVYSDQGRWKEAEELYLQVLEVRKKVLGAEHPDTLSSMDDLAATYVRNDRWEGAEELYLQVLEAKRRELGVEHRDTLRSMNHVAVTFVKQGRWEEAEKLYLRVLESRKGVPETEHPDTLESMYNLAICLERQGRHREATELMTKVVDLHTKRLGANHPDTKDAEDCLKRWSDD